MNKKYKDYVVLSIKEYNNIKNKESDAIQKYNESINKINDLSIEINNLKKAFSSYICVVNKDIINKNNNVGQIKYALSDEINYSKRYNFYEVLIDKIENQLYWNEIRKEVNAREHIEGIQNKTKSYTK